VALLYWFGEDDGITERFTYNSESYAADRAYISALLARLNALDVAEFPLTADLQHCRACQYRALCERDQVSGTFETEDADLFPDLDELRELIAAAVASEDFVL